MCRLVMALGKFSIEKLVDAAIGMSEGRLSDHDGPLLKHINGWGAVWRDRNSPTGISVYRNVGQIDLNVAKEVLQNVDTDFLAIHIRHATVSKNVGINFVHPLNSSSHQIQWYMMHNGYLPTIHEKLNMNESVFDTQEYYDYILPKNLDFLNGSEIISKLNHLKVGGTSANAIIVNPSKIYVIHWSMPDISSPKYFTLNTTYDDRALYISSEMRPEITKIENWKPLIHSKVHEFLLPQKAMDKDFLLKCYRGLYE